METNEEDHQPKRKRGKRNNEITSMDKKRRSKSFRWFEC